MPDFIIIDGQKIREKIEDITKRVPVQGVKFLWGDRAYLAGGCHYNAEQLRLIAAGLDEIGEFIDEQRKNTGSGAQGA